MTKKLRGNHGGKRLGAGRKGPRKTHVTIACSLDSVAADQIRALAKARAQSVGEYVRAALMHAVDHQLRGEQ